MINIIIQYCNTDNQQRQAEFDFCVLQNLNNPYVKMVFNLVESKTVVPISISQHPKYKEFRHDRWLTYAEAFKFAQNNIPHDEAICLSNLDIFLDTQSSWEKIWTLINQSHVLCLARHEYEMQKTPYVNPESMKRLMATSQDCWIFKNPIKIFDCDFEIGSHGCDHAIANRIKNSGLFPINLPFTFKIFHYDVARKNLSQSEKYQQQSKNQNSFAAQHNHLYLAAFELSQQISLDGLIQLIRQSDDPRIAATANALHYAMLCEFYSTFYKTSPPI